MKNDVPLQLRYGGGALLCLGPALTLLAGVSFLAAKSAQGWPTVQARVLRSNVEVSKKASGFRGSRTIASDYFTAAVEYQYVVDGKQYTSDKIQRSSNPSGFDRSWVEQWTRKYPRGAEITIHYAPKNPSLAVIDPRPDVVGLSLILGAGLIMIPVGLWMRQFAQKLQPSTPKPVTVHAPAPVAAPASRAAAPASGAVPVPPRRNETLLVAPRKTHGLLRTLAVLFGLAIFLLGALALPKGVELCIRSLNAPAPAAADIVASSITLAIVAGTVGLGAYLIWKGVTGARRVRVRSSEGSLSA